MLRPLTIFASILRTANREHLPGLQQKETRGTQDSANVNAESARLADAQFVLARSYGLSSWPRLVTACRMIDAIWRGDVETVRTMVRKNPKLIVEDARGVKGNWGPPMSYAANLGQDAIIEMLRGLGAADLEFAFDRACLQGTDRDGPKAARNDGSAKA